MERESLSGLGRGRVTGGKYTGCGKLRGLGPADFKRDANRSSVGVGAAFDNPNRYVRIFLCVKLCFGASTQIDRIGGLMKNFSK